MEKKQFKIGAAVGVLLAAIVSIVSAFLPLYMSGSEAQSSYMTDSGGGVGKMILFTAGAAGLLALVTILTKNRVLSKITGVISILAAIGLAGTNGVIMLGFGQLSVTASTGVYVLFAGAALLFITGIMSLASNKK